MLLNSNHALPKPGRGRDEICRINPHLCTLTVPIESQISDAKMREKLSSHFPPIATEHKLNLALLFLDHHPQ